MDYTPQRRSTAAAANTPATSSKLNITLGIEHELLVLDSQRLDYKDQQKSDHGLSLVSEALREPIQVTCSSCDQVHDYEQPIRVQNTLNDNSDHSCWNLVGDTSMKLNNRQNARLLEKKCEAYGVELTSRVLSANQAKPTKRPRAQARHTHTHAHTTTYQEEISQFINTMNRLFPQTSAIGHRQERRVVVNDSCSLHVHIGNETAGFELQTVKNILSIYTAFERVIDSMHAKSRIGCSSLASCPLEGDYGLEGNIMNVADEGKLFPGHNRSLTERIFSSAYVTRRDDGQTSLLAAAQGSYPANQMDNNAILKQAASGYHTMAFIEVIQQAPNIESLQQLMSLCCETSVNILHLVVKEGENLNEQRSYRRLNTVEFRQHAAVTDPKEALAWIDFLQTLVKYAHSQSADDIRSICEHAASNPHFHLADLFELLSVNEQRRDFYLTRTKESVQATFDLARAEAEALDSNGPFRAISLELIDERATDHDPYNVASIIKEKFEQGGYGQFTRKFIDAYAPHLSEDDKERLTIGGVVPAEIEDFESENKDSMAVDDDDEMYLDY